MDQDRDQEQAPAGRRRLRPGPGADRPRRLDPRHPRSLAAGATGLDRLLGLLLLASAGLLVLGWTLPIMTVRKLLILSERVSILEGAADLWGAGHYGLFAMVVVFSVVFPVAKLILALAIWYRTPADDGALGRPLHWLEILGRWSMLDVFVVALTVVAIQVSLINEVAVHAGIYVFASAILLSLVATQRMTALARRSGPGRA